MKNDQKSGSPVPADNISYLVLQVPEETRPSLDVFFLVKAVWAWKWFIGSFTFAAMLLMAFNTVFLMENKYQAYSVLEPVGGGAKNSALLSLAGGLLPNISMNDDKTKIMLNYLKSYSLKSWMIKEFDLLARYSPKIYDAANRKWLVPESSRPTVDKFIQRGKMDGVFSSDHDQKTGLIRIYFTDREPVFAAKVLTGVIARLEHYVNKDYLTDAKRKRLFVEDQLKKAREEFDYWRKKVPSGEYPAYDIQIELTAASQIYSELRKEYELAKIEENKQLLSFKVLDPPVVPVIRHSPKRTLLCLLAGIVAGFGSLMMVLLVAGLSNYIGLGDRNGSTDPPQYARV